MNEANSFPPSESSRLLSCLNHCAALFAMNPYKFLFEYDLQSFIYSELDRYYPETIQAFANSPGRVSISRVHREYPYGSLFDVVVLSKDSGGDPEEDNIYSRPIQFVVELKLAPYGTKKVKAFDPSKDDIMSLSKKVKNLRHPDALKMAVQLTAFHLEETQNYFLENMVNNSNCNQVVRQVLDENDRLKMMYFDLTSGKARDVVEL